MSFHKWRIGSGYDLNYYRVKSLPCRFNFIFHFLFVQGAFHFESPAKCQQGYVSKAFAFAPPADADDALVVHLTKKDMALMTSSGWEVDEVPFVMKNPFAIVIREDGTVCKSRLCSIFHCALT